MSSTSNTDVGPQRQITSIYILKPDLENRHGVEEIIFLDTKEEHETFLPRPDSDDEKLQLSTVMGSWNSSTTNRASECHCQCGRNDVATPAGSNM